MKRRQFLKSTIAAASTPLLPGGISAKTLPVSPEQYAKAAHWARLWVYSTAATFQNTLGISFEAGQAVMKQLERDGIIGAQDGLGVARAITAHFEIPEVAARIEKSIGPKLPSTNDVSSSIDARISPEAAQNRVSDVRKVRDELEYCARPTARPGIAGTEPNAPQEAHPAII